jgi:hypothetical protein
MVGDRRAAYAPNVRQDTRGRLSELIGAYIGSLAFVVLGLGLIVFARPIGRLHSRLQRAATDALYGREAVARAQPPLESMHPEVVYAWIWRGVGVIEGGFGLWVLVLAMTSGR